MTLLLEPEIVASPVVTDLAHVPAGLTSTLSTALIAMHTADTPDQHAVAVDAALIAALPTVQRIAKIFAVSWPAEFVDAEDLRARLVEVGMLAERRRVAESIVHIAERVLWEEARTTGSYPWSSHGSSYDAEGFVHLAYRRQVAGVIDRYFSRFEPKELVLLELDPDRARPIVEEGSTESFPHLFAPLTPEMVVRELDVHEPFNGPA